MCTPACSVLSVTVPQQGSSRGDPAGSTWLPPPKVWRRETSIVATVRDVPWHRRGGASHVVAAIAAAVVAPFAVAPPTACSPQGKPATASSGPGPDLAASPSTTATPAPAGAASGATRSGSAVDLGAPPTISQVVLSWEGAYGKSFKIQTSANGTTWTDIYTTTTGAGGTQTLTVTGSGRYVRMYGTVRGTGYGYSL